MEKRDVAWVRLAFVFMLVLVTACDPLDKLEPTPTAEEPAATVPPSPTTTPATPTAEISMPGEPAADGAIIGAMFHPYEIKPYCAQMPTYGIRGMTLAFTWQQVEPQKGVFRWAEVDEFIELARSCGLEIGVHVYARSAWATEPHPDEVAGKVPAMPPQNQEDYYHFMYNLAAHYRGQISRYSIENEALSPNNWGSTPAKYAEMLATAYRAVHDADPEAIVENAGMSGSGLTYLVAADMYRRGQRQEAVDFLRTAWAQFNPGRMSPEPIQVETEADLEDLMNQPLPRRVQDWMDMLVANQAHYDAFQIHFFAPPEQLPVVMDWVHEQLQAHGGDKPIELWEFGYGWSDRSTFDLTAQAQAVPKLLASAVGEGAPFAIFWRFTDQVEQVVVGQTGLVTAAGPRPAAKAFQLMAHALNGVTEAERLDLGEEVWGYRFRKGSDEFYVVWRLEPGTGTIALPLSSEAVSVTDINGETSTVSSQAIPVGVSPILVTSE